MLGVAASVSRLWLPSLAGGGHVVPGASHLMVTHDARPGRILRAAPQVMSRPHVHDSNRGDFVSHPNDPAQQPRGLGELWVPEPLHAPAVCCSGWFGATPL